MQFDPFEEDLDLREAIFHIVGFRVTHAFRARSCAKVRVEDLDKLTGSLAFKHCPVANAVILQGGKLGHAVRSIGEPEGTLVVLEELICVVVDGVVLGRERVVALFAAQGSVARILERVVGGGNVVRAGLLQTDEVRTDVRCVLSNRAVAAVAVLHVVAHEGESGSLFLITDLNAFDVRVDHVHVTVRILEEQVAADKPGTGLGNDVALDEAKDVLVCSRLGDTLGNGGNQSVHHEVFRNGLTGHEDAALHEGVTGRQIAHKSRHERAVVIHKVGDEGNGGSKGLGTVVNGSHGAVCIRHGELDRLGGSIELAVHVPVGEGGGSGFQIDNFGVTHALDFGAGAIGDGQIEESGVVVLITSIEGRICVDRIVGGKHAVSGIEALENVAVCGGHRRSARDFGAAGNSDGGEDLTGQTVLEGDGMSGRSIGGGGKHRNEFHGGSAVSEGEVHVGGKDGVVALVLPVKEVVTGGGHGDGGTDGGAEVRGSGNCGAVNLCADRSGACDSKLNGGVGNQSGLIDLHQARGSLKVAEIVRLAGAGRNAGVTHAVPGTGGGKRSGSAFVQGDVFESYVVILLKVERVDRMVVANGELIGGLGGVEQNVVGETAICIHDHQEAAFGHVKVAVLAEFADTVNAGRLGGQTLEGVPFVVFGNVVKIVVVGLVVTHSHAGLGPDERGVGPGVCIGRAVVHGVRKGDAIHVDRDRGGGGKDNAGARDGHGTATGGGVLAGGGSPTETVDEPVTGGAGAGSVKCGLIAAVVDDVVAVVDPTLKCVPEGGVVVICGNGIQTVVDGLGILHLLIFHGRDGVTLETEVGGVGDQSGRIDVELVDEHVGLVGAVIGGNAGLRVIQVDVEEVDRRGCTVAKCNTAKRGAAGTVGLLCHAVDEELGGLGNRVKGQGITVVRGLRGVEEVANGRGASK